MTDEQLAYRWTVHLARQMPERLPVVVLVLLGAPLLGGMLMGHWLFGLVAFWMLFSATADYLLPIRYEADAQGVRQRGLAPRVMRWEQVVLLSPLAHPSRLDAYRGIFLWYGDQRDQIEQLVRAYCRAAESQSKSARKKRKRGEVSRYA
jgi:hypothetical protein